MGIGQAILLITIAAGALGGFAWLMLFLIRSVPADGRFIWNSFQYQGETFIWVPDEDEGLFDDPYAHGSFTYADGTPVTDLMTLKLLQDYWVANYRRSAWHSQE